MDYSEHAEIAHALVERCTGVRFSQPSIISNPYIVEMYARAGKISPRGEMAFIPEENAVLIGPVAGQIMAHTISLLPFAPHVHEQMRDKDRIYMLTHEFTHAAVHAVRQPLEGIAENFPLFIRDEGLCEHIAMRGMALFGHPVAEAVAALHQTYHDIALERLSSAPIDSLQWQEAAHAAVKTANGLVELKYALGWRFAHAVMPTDSMAFANEHVTFEDLIDPQSYLRTRSCRQTCPGGRSS